MDPSKTDQHVVAATPIKKMDGGVIGYQFQCSCGRQGKGRHDTEAKAIVAGHDHVDQHADQPGTGTNVITMGNRT